jgi:hypothetical protein
MRRAQRIRFKARFRGLSQEFWQQKRPGRNRTDLPHHRLLTSASTSVVKSISAMRRCEQRISALISNAYARVLPEKCVRNKSQLENNTWRVLNKELA